MNKTRISTNSSTDTITEVDNRKIIDVNQINTDCLTSNNNKFNLDIDGNLTVHSITSEISVGGLNFNDVYPVGSIYLSVSDTNPGSLFGGRWELFGAGKTLVCVSSGEGEFNAAEKTGGEKYHTLSANEMPSHTHAQDAHRHLTYKTYTIKYAAGSKVAQFTGMTADGLAGSNNYTDYTTATNQYTGGNANHNNMMPYITCYFWKRVA